jgi:hypothetical protein
MARKTRLARHRELPGPSHIHLVQTPANEEQAEQVEEHCAQTEITQKHRRAGQQPDAQDNNAGKKITHPVLSEQFERPSIAPHRVKARSATTHAQGQSRLAEPVDHIRGTALNSGR